MLKAWDEIEIEDELSSSTPADEAEPVLAKSQSFKSKLNVPMVCSPLIQNILYTVCQQLTKNLSFTMIETNLILKELILSIFEIVLEAYKHLLSAQKNSSLEQIRLTQNQALQTVFDLKFLYALFDFKSTALYVNASSSEFADTNRKFNVLLDEYKEVCAMLESFIDPFDYDICAPFIQSKIAKCISRSAVGSDFVMNFF